MTLLIACALIANISLHSVLVTSQHQENSPLLTVWIVSLAGLRNTIVGISYVIYYSLFIEGKKQFSR